MVSLRDVSGKLPAEGKMAFPVPQVAEFSQRFKIFFRLDDQPLLGFALTIGLLVFIIYYGALSFRNKGLIAIDQAERKQFQYQLDLNTATWPEWVVLPGIGEKLAKGIVDHRQQHGNFEKHEDIMLVPRIGTFKRQQLAPFLLPIEEQPR